MFLILAIPQNENTIIINTCEREKKNYRKINVMHCTLRRMKIQWPGGGWCTRLLLLKKKCFRRRNITRQITL